MRKIFQYLWQFPSKKSRRYDAANSNYFKQYFGAHIVWDL